MSKPVLVGLLLTTVLGGPWLVGCNQPGRQVQATPRRSTAESPSQPERAVASGSSKEGPDLHLFVPCGMIIPFNELRRSFEGEQGVEVKITYDNAVVLMRKIRDKGQRPDILVTPGITEMKIMEEDGFINPSQVVTFGTFKLVLVVPKANKAGITSVQDLATDRVRSIALADPKENSVGYYGQKALENLGLWSQVQPKLRKHWHALTTVNYVCNGQVDAGLYYQACPFDTAPEKIEQQTWKFAGEIPQEAYPRVRVQAGILKEAGHPELAQSFLKYLLTEDTQALLAEKGIPNFEGGEE